MSRSRAARPDRIEPSSRRLTADGVSVSPRALGMSRAVVPSRTATREFVVPRSMPQIAIRAPLGCGLRMVAPCAYLSGGESAGQHGPNGGRRGTGRHQEGVGKRTLMAEIDEIRALLASR